MYDLGDDIVSVIFSYLNLLDATVLRAVSKSSAELVTKYPWRNDSNTVVHNTKLWRECFPVAISARLSRTATDNDLSYLSGIHCLNLSCCDQITDKGLSYLTGISELNLSWCNQITDNGLSYLKGISNLNLSHCRKITDQGLSYLKGISKLNLHGCLITDQGLSCLTDIRELNLTWCNLITDHGLSYLTDIKYLDLSWCWKITDKAVSSLRLNQNLRLIYFNINPHIGDKMSSHRFRPSYY
jgi:hypothetical protein